MASASDIIGFLSLMMGIIYLLAGAIMVYVCILGIRGRIKPNGAVGFRMNLSKNYKLYQQDKYWYELNRYGGKKVLPLGILWMLLGAAEILLPLDPRLKIDLLFVFTLLITAGLILVARHLYRYAERLVSSPMAEGAASA